MVQGLTEEGWLLAVGSIPSFGSVFERGEWGRKLVRKEGGGVVGGAFMGMILGLGGGLEGVGWKEIGRWCATLAVLVSLPVALSVVGFLWVVKGLQQVCAR